MHKKVLRATPMDKSNITTNKAGLASVFLFLFFILFFNLNSFWSSRRSAGGVVYRRIRAREEE